MGGYTVLARRYRSTNFDELVGQEPISRTLKNAVASDRVAHAYLFCGSRGVGKTSMARIFAKTLSVTDDLTQADQIAEAIMRGDDLDVIEIDGASNRGINEARDLIAAAGLSPARCPFKIYIIDEVHMLTKEAFNALLKTMEEPPKHVKFILCTTEPHKVPATIQSRCQRFDFRLLSTAEIAGQLRRILKMEGIEADDQVVAQVARLGRGSMRDALSLLDRLLSLGEKSLTAELLDQMLGLPDHALTSALVDAIAAGDAKAALSGGAELLDRGATVDQALGLLIEHLRNLLLITACGEDSEIVEMSREARAAAAKQAGNFDAPGLVHMIALCDSVARSARGSTTARALFDAAITRLALSEHFADISELLGDATPDRGPKKKEPVKRAPSQLSAESLVEPKQDSTIPVPTPSPASPTTGQDPWQQVKASAGESPDMLALIEHLVLQAIDGETWKFTLDTSDAGLVRWLSSQTTAVAKLIRAATLQRATVIIDAPQLPKPSETRIKIEQAQKLPLVRTAMEIFDADVVDVQTTQPGSPDDV